MLYNTCAARISTSLAVVTLLFSADAHAASDTAGKAIAIGLPIVAGGVTLLHDWDWRGVKELAVNEALDIGTALLLKQIVHEQRPDHSDFKSFPSLTTAVAAGSASYLWDRYGWEYGAPAYLATGYVGYSVVNAKDHHWWDALASVGIAWGYSRLITSEWRDERLETSLNATPHSVMLAMKFRW